MASRESSALCASCDRCRARKTRCDGQRPCSACKLKYMKKHKLTNVDGVDPARFECFYSPAKRRGPVPGMKHSKFNSPAEGASAMPRKKKPVNKTSRPQTSAQSQQATSAEAATAHGGLSISIAEDGSVTSMATGGGYGVMSVSGMSANTGKSQRMVKTEVSVSANANGDYAGNNGNNGSYPLLPPLDPNAAAMQQHVLSTLGSIGFNIFSTPNSLNNGSNLNNSNRGGGGGGGMGTPSVSSAALSVGHGASSGGQDTMATAQNAAQQQLAYIQQLQLQQQMQAQKKRRDMNHAALGKMDAAASVHSIQSGGTARESAGTIPVANGHAGGSTGSTRQLSPLVVPVKQENGAGDDESRKRVIGCENPNVMKYLHLTRPTNPHGMHLRACYTLSSGSLFGLPPIPTDEEYCRRFDKSLEPHQLPKFDVAALQAVRFAELAMGAMADSNSNNQSRRSGSLLLALANASVLCLRDCVEEWVHPSLMFDIARTYFFHAIFRAHFDDIERYFKYRRVCLRHLAQLDGVPGAEKLLSAMSFQDSLAYMLHNSSEDGLPNIDGEIPRVSPPHDVEASKTTDAEKKYSISISPSRVASNPINQIWIQGTPIVLINEAAPPKSRVLDALACAIRSSLDEAKSRQTKEPTQSSRGKIVSRKRKFLSDAEAKDKSATEWAVEHHPEELSCSNLMAQASSLLKKDEDAWSPALPSIFGGHRLLVLGLDVIMNSDREAENFQLQRIFNVLEGMIERPILLFQGGPTYHIFNNCAIFLAHIINRLHADGFSNEFSRAQFCAALNVYNGARMVLGKHRGRLPARSRCHELPPPSVPAVNNGGAVIDLGNVALCPSRNCQDCVDPGIPATDAAKRAASKSYDRSNWQRSESEKEFDANDRALLSVLSRIIAQEDCCLC